MESSTESTTPERFTYDYINEEIAKLNSSLDVVESWKLAEAPWHFLRDALAWNDRNGDYDESMTIEDMRGAAHIQFVEDN